MEPNAPESTQPNDSSRALQRLERWLPHGISTIALLVSLWSLLATFSEQRQNREEKVEEALDAAFDLLGEPPGSHSQEGIHGRAWDPKALEAANRKIDLALRLQPESERAYRLQAMYFVGRGQYALAEKSAREAIRLSPRSVEAYNTLGTVYHVKLDIASAEAAFKSALSLNPSDHSALMNLSHLSLHHGNPAASIPMLQRAAALPEADSATFFRLALALGIAGRREEALEAAQRAVEHDPGNPAAVEVLAYALAGVGRTADAITAFRRVAELDPERAESAIKAAELIEKDPKYEVRFRLFTEDPLSLLIRPKSEDARDTDVAPIRSQGAGGAPSLTP